MLIGFHEDPDYLIEHVQHELRNVLKIIDPHPKHLLGFIKDPNFLMQKYEILIWSTVP